MPPASSALLHHGRRRRRSRRSLSRLSLGRISAAMAAAATFALIGSTAPTACLAFRRASVGPTTRASLLHPVAMRPVVPLQQLQQQQRAPFSLLARLKGALASSLQDEEVDPGVVEGTDLRIVKYPDPRLRAPNAEVAPGEFTPELQKLAKDMFKVMYAANGVGLAAPQVGVNKRLMVFNPGACVRVGVLWGGFVVRFFLPGLELDTHVNDPGRPLDFDHSHVHVHTHTHTRHKY
jgi:hypothetical protein